MRPGGSLPAWGRAPQPGTLLRNPALARTLQAHCRGWEGRLLQGGRRPERISAYLEREGGYLREAISHPIPPPGWSLFQSSTKVTRILVLPPNTQGIAQLQLLEMAKGLGLGRDGSDRRGLPSHSHRAEEVGFCRPKPLGGRSGLRDIPVDRVAGRSVPGRAGRHGGDGAAAHRSVTSGGRGSNAGGAGLPP